LRATWQSQQNKRISRDAHVSPMGFLSMTEDKLISRDAHVETSSLLSMTKDRIIGRSLDLAYRLGGMTSLKDWFGGMTKDKVISRDLTSGLCPSSA